MPKVTAKLTAEQAREMFPYGTMQMYDSVGFPFPVRVGRLSGIMPAKNVTKRPQHVIDEAVKRHMAGESVAVLAKYYKISKPGFYLWVKHYKQRLLEQSSRSEMTPRDAETADKRVLIAEIQALKLENTKLRNKVVALMIKTGEL